MEIEVKEVAFRRKFNLGNYETFDVELVATVSENQNAKDVIKALDDMTIQYRNQQRGVKV